MNKRWTLEQVSNYYASSFVLAEGPDLDDGDTIEVMAVSEYERLQDTFKAVEALYVAYCGDQNEDEYHAALVALFDAAIAPDHEEES